MTGILSDSIKLANGRSRKNNDPDVYRQCAAQGLTLSETAEKLNITLQAVCFMSKRHNIAFVDGQTARRIRTLKARIAADLAEVMRLTGDIK